MFKAIHCNTSQHTFQHITSIDDIKAIKHDPDTLFWLDLEAPGEQDLARIAEEFKLHPLAIEDTSHEHQRPKVDEYENFYFVVFYTVYFNAEMRRVDVRELDMFLSEKYLITVHQKPIPELGEVEQRWTRNARQLEWGIGILLYSLLDTVVDSYFPFVEKLVDQAEDLEDRLFEGAVRQSTLTMELLALKKHFLTLRRVIIPERDVLNVLTNRDSPIFSEHVNVYFRDIYDHITRLADTLDLYRDQLSSTMDANLSVASNELNKVMRTMTACSIILMFDALIAGIYGMNFENMPELKLPYGYFACLLLMFAITLCLIVYFKRRQWL